MAFSAPGEEDDTGIDALSSGSIRYLSLDDVYSATSPASGSSILMSKKIKARKFENISDDPKNASGCEGSCIDEGRSGRRRPRDNAPMLHVYSRRNKRQLVDDAMQSGSFFDLLSRAKLTVTNPAKVEPIESDRGRVVVAGVSDIDELVNTKKKRMSFNGELPKLGVVSSAPLDFKGPRLRENRNHMMINSQKRKPTRKSEGTQSMDDGLQNKKRWVRLSFEDVDPNAFIGLQCKVFWPLDVDWYTGSIVGYDLEIGKHHVKYEDGDTEDINLAQEKIKFFTSPEEMQRLNLKYGSKSTSTDSLSYDEMVVLAAGWDDFQELESGDIVWAKLTGHAMWPGIIVDDSLMTSCSISNKISAGKSVSVHFFGTHDFARIKTKQVISFLKGLNNSFHLKCKKPLFIQGLEEAKVYLSEQRLPRRMVRLQSDPCSGDCVSLSDEGGECRENFIDCINEEPSERFLGGIGAPPYVIGDLQITSLGRIMRDSSNFQDGEFTCPKGYTAVRKFTSVTDPSTSAVYKMEVLEDAKSRGRPLFKVTLGSGEQIKGSTPSACWDKIYCRMKACSSSANGSASGCCTERIPGNGSDMFGFSNPEVIKLIQALSKSRNLSKSFKCKNSSQDLPAGYRPVRVEWKDLDRCNVCHMDEEYSNNLFLQCDKCRMMVHARCYGELEPVDGVLWFCNLCRPGAPTPPPICCLCPVVGGAMKPTTDGRWAHLACAMWIPETCLSDVKRMEPIDGISRIHRDRWKLFCNICGVAYGACIQCSNNSCRVAYHPLCARAADLCVELEDEERLHLLSFDDDEENQCIRLFSFCKRHKQPSNERRSEVAHIGQIASQCCDYNPPTNPTGCARTEPYNYFGRRGRKEPAALAAASLKRSFVENQPYLVSGYCQHELLGKEMTYNEVTLSKYASSLQRLVPENISSMAEKYGFMRETFRKRLAFGKSGIHGFGIFAKQEHRAGDMVIEYTGELVRPPIADRREHFIYNSLVGAGTYMFRIDEERVIDATRAGSIAHLINHSCEPNCYSRVITVNGDDHIIIFAKRDIKRWEELTYDYRFFSIDERLACYCGFERCRGVVNDTESEEQAAKLRVPCSELYDWNGE
ncbi:hypothetical protein SAY87_000944 [Trapa incisa]|uniref:Histone-lysine N-methyltransferase ATX2 n=1 Tax=Trapa incisa TaxID=236973 RepID=A0AAN7JHG7_9MYRT|nr:hypothetical protein SAY87_000944 [Trapa incisa]